MAFSMHSHSGQFCPGHAKDQLEDVVKRAISLKMRAFALTEHMPRDQPTDLYPEEIIDGQSPEEAVKVLFARHPEYVKEAVRLREKYKQDINIVIGIEGEWIRPSYAELIENLLQDPDVDFFLGSVHHMHEIPIDFDQQTYNQAREVAGGSDERLWEDYYDAQYEMLQRLKPKVVGHFDLIRLLSDDPNIDPQTMPGVWDRITRNLKLIREQDGLVEINSSALRKGLKEPYPVKSICVYHAQIGGRFTLSDDSHGVAQVGLNFARALQHLQEAGVKSLYYLERALSSSTDSCKPSVLVGEVDLDSINADHHPSTN